VSPPTLTALVERQKKVDPNENSVGPPSGQGTAQNSSARAKESSNFVIQQASPSDSLSGQTLGIIKRDSSPKGGRQGATYDIITDRYVQKTELKTVLFSIGEVPHSSTLPKPVAPHLPESSAGSP